MTILVLIFRILLDEVAGYGTHVLGWSSSMAMVPMCWGGVAPWLWYPCVGVE